MCFTHMPVYVVVSCDWISYVCSSDLHVFSVGHVWESDLYPAVSVSVGAARFLNEHLSVNIVCCPVLIPEHMRATLVLLRASPIIGLAPFAFCPGTRRKRLKTQGLRSEEHTS